MNDRLLPELRQLRSFIEVAECLSFSKAAERLGIAQPPLTQQIRRLEARIGFPLFVRTRSGTNRVLLTESGLVLYEGSKRVLNVMMSVLESVQIAGNGAIKKLRVGFVSSSATTFVAPLVRNFRINHPDIELRLTEMTTLQQREALLSEHIDVGIGSDVENPGSDFCSERLRVDRIVAILPETMRLESLTPLPMTALRDENFIFFPKHRGAAFYRTMILPCLRSGYEPRVVQEAQEWPTLMALVAAGLGVSLIPERLTGQAPAGTRVVQIDDALAETSLCSWRLSARRRHIFEDYAASYAGVTS